MVYGINHDKLTKDHIVISNASCTTNCLAPLAAVLHEAVGIEKGMMTTIHSYTGDQPTLDTMHKDLYRARAAALSQIPTSTGAAKAIGLVLPELKGKLDGISIRVPTPNVSVVDFKFIAKRTTTVEEINDALIAASNGKLKGILGRHQPSERLDRLQPRSAFLDRGARPDQGHGRQFRVASCPGTTTNGASRTAWPTPPSPSPRPSPDPARLDRDFSKTPGLGRAFSFAGNLRA